MNNRLTMLSVAAATMLAGTAAAQCDSQKSSASSQHGTQMAATAAQHGSQTGATTVRAVSYGVDSSDIVETAVDAGSFKILTTALDAAGLVAPLRGEGPFTVFAPTDEAFSICRRAPSRCFSSPRTRRC